MCGFDGGFDGGFDNDGFDGDFDSDGLDTDNQGGDEGSEDLGHDESIDHDSEAPDSVYDDHESHDDMPESDEEFAAAEKQRERDEEYDRQIDKEAAEDIEDAQTDENLEDIEEMDEDFDEFDEEDEEEQADEADDKLNQDKLWEGYVNELFKHEEQAEESDEDLNEETDETGEKVEWPYAGEQLPDRLFDSPLFWDEGIKPYWNESDQEIKQPDETADKEIVESEIETHSDNESELNDAVMEDLQKEEEHEERQARIDKETDNDDEIEKDFEEWKREDGVPINAEETEADKLGDTVVETEKERELDEKQMAKRTKKDSYEAQKVDFYGKSRRVYHRKPYEYEYNVKTPMNDAMSGRKKLRRPRYTRRKRTEDLSGRITEADETKFRGDQQRAYEYKTYPTKQYESLEREDYRENVEDEEKDDFKDIYKHTGKRLP